MGAQDARDLMQKLLVTMLVDRIEKARLPQEEEKDE